MTMETEIWKAILGISGMEVSSHGIVRTLDMVVPCGNHTQFVKGRILKPQDNGTGYLQVGFYKDGKQVRRYVHRLVAQTFIKNPNNWPEVNHKDNDRTNNCVDNLEWCSKCYNRQYREKYGVSQTEAAGHPVFAINLKTLKVSHFSSQSEASRALGVYVGNISKVLKGKYRQTGGYLFMKSNQKAIEQLKQRDDIPLDWDKVTLEEAE